MNIFLRTSDGIPICIEVIDNKMVVGKKYRGGFPRCAEGYVTEGSFDMEELRELGLIGRNGRVYIGIFRGDNPNDGTKYRWLSWVVADKLPRPNFHHPYSQGVAYLR